MRARILLLLVTALAVSACGAIGISPILIGFDHTPRPTSRPTDGPAPYPTDTPSPTATWEPEPTATWEPEPTATWEPEPTATWEPDPTPTAAPLAELSYETWSDDHGYITTEVPAGWTVKGGLGEAGFTDGQFQVQATSPDGRTRILFAHNATVFMESYYGTYYRGARTIEKIVLPDFVSREGVRSSRVTYRSANEHVDYPYGSGSIPLDSGTLGFAYLDAAGNAQYGTAAAQTLHITSPGTPGAWRLRLFASALAPADAASQAQVRAAIDHMIDHLRLSGDFVQQWNEGFSETQRIMAGYSDAMARVFESSASSAGSTGDSADAWASYMRGGEYATDEATGDAYWVSNDTTYHFVSDRGVVIGNDTGDVPADGGTWTPLVPNR
jgi:hypothetical protein